MNKHPTTTYSTAAVNTIGSTANNPFAKNLFTPLHFTRESAHRERVNFMRSALALDAPDGAKAGDLVGHAGLLHDVDDERRVLIGLGHLLGDRVAAVGHDDDAAVLLHLLEEVASPGAPLHLVARVGAAGAVAGGSEGLAHRALTADEEEAGAAHVARNERGLAELAVRGRKERMAGAERAGGP